MATTLSMGTNKEQTQISRRRAMGQVCSALEECVYRCLSVKEMSARDSELDNLRQALQALEAKYERRLQATLGKCC